VGPSCHGLVINLLGFLITLLDAAQTWCSWLFLFSFCSWSSQGQTWMCPCFFENQCGRFPGNLMLSNYYICWIGAGFIAWKGLLERIFSWSRKQRLERQKVEENGNFECKGTKQLGSKLFQQVWVSQGEFNISIFWSPVCDLPVSYSWHRNNPASLCWWELSGIFVGALWGSILYGVMFRKWLEYVDLQRVHRFALLL
jgi:hypothetical protein